MPDKPDAVGPCARCGRKVSNAHMIGSLLVGKVCWKKMLAEGFSELVHKCPMCHSVLPDDHKLTVKEGAVVLEPTVKRRSLDEFVDAPDGLLPVEIVIQEEGGKGHDGKTANSGVNESGWADGTENVPSARRADGQTDDAEVLHRGEEPPSDPPEDA